MDNSEVKNFKLKFDIKNKDLLVWNNEIIMSRTEEDYFKKMFIILEKLNLCTDSILEIGFGLGISGSLIQKHLIPTKHHIVEIEANIFKDLLAFTQENSGVVATLGDWRLIDLPEKEYDFIFNDAYDYGGISEYANFSYDYHYLIFSKILKDDGVICHPHFGDGPVRDVKGFKTTIVERLKVNPIVMWDQSICEDAAIVLRRKD